MLSVNTRKKKAHGDNCLSYPFLPSLKLFVPLFLHCCWGQIKPIRLDLLSIFLEDSMGSGKMVFLLKIVHSKSAGNMVQCGPNLRTSKVLFSLLILPISILEISKRSKNYNVFGETGVHWVCHFSHSIHEHEDIAQNSMYDTLKCPCVPGTI